MPEKHDMATLTAPFGERRTARSTTNDHARRSTTVRKPGGLLTSQATAKMSTGTSLGKVVDSHNPQRVEISERASAARGAMQLRESGKQTRWIGLLPRWSLTLYTFALNEKTRGSNWNADCCPSRSMKTFKFKHCWGRITNSVFRPTAGYIKPLPGV